MSHITVSYTTESNAQVTETWTLDVCADDLADCSLGDYVRENHHDAKREGEVLVHERDGSAVEFGTIEFLS